MLIDLMYLVGITLATPYILLKMSTSERFRAGLAQRLGWVPVRKGQGPCLWVHAASVGEVLTAKPLICEIERELPDYDVVITTSTNTGYSVAKKNFANKEIFYFPLDLSWIIKKILCNIRPACIILTELEIWPNLLIQAKKQNIPVVVVNGRISERSVRVYKAVSFFSREFTNALTSPPNIYCARTQSDAESFHQLGIDYERIPLTGTMKYDNILTRQDETITDHFARLFNIENGCPVIIGGSTHEGEEAALLSVYKTLRDKIPDLKIILAPRHIERTKDVVSLIKGMGFTCVQKTHLDEGKTLPDNAVILIDTVGDLAKIYPLASCVFIGKSLCAKGGQNVMEPAGMGVPVVCGPFMYNFKEEMQLLLENQAVKVVNDEGELLNTVQSFLENPESAREMGHRAKQVILENKGTTKRNIAILKNILKKRGN